MTTGLEMPKANPGPHGKAVRLILDGMGMEPRERGYIFIFSTVGAEATQTLELVLVRLANVSPH